MPRPIKHSVDYFPHFVNHGKTLYILSNEFGEVGYAFWFRLLELLCRSEGQVYDYNNSVAWRFLLAETHASEENAKNILKLLADVEAIDLELFEAKIIWVQRLVDNLDAVYKRRSDGTPTRPVIANSKMDNADNNGIDVDKSTHSKQNKIKQNKTTYIPYPEFKNVNKMSKEEHQKLIDRFGEAGARDKVENLSLYIASKGDKYRNHYATILSWDKKDGKGGNHGTHKQPTANRPATDAEFNDEETIADRERFDRELANDIR